MHSQDGTSSFSVATLNRRSHRRARRHPIEALSVAGTCRAGGGKGSGPGPQRSAPVAGASRDWTGRDADRGTGARGSRGKGHRLGACAPGVQALVPDSVDGSSTESIASLSPSFPPSLPSFDAYFHSTVTMLFLFAFFVVCFVLGFAIVGPLAAIDSGMHRLASREWGWCVYPDVASYSSLVIIEMIINLESSFRKTYYAIFHLCVISAKVARYTFESCST